MSAARRAGLLVVAAIGLSTVSNVAAAGELAWHAPRGCPEATEVIARVRAAGSPDPRDVDVDVTGRVYAEAEGGYRVELDLRVADTQTQRIVEAENCEVATRAAAMIIAVALDPLAVVAVVKEVLPEPAAAVLPAEEPRPTPPADRKREPARTPVRFVLRPEVFVGTGLMPGAVQVGPSLALGAAWTHARIELAGSGWVPREVTVDGDRGGRIWGGAATARGCGGGLRGRVDPWVCGGVAVGGMSGRGVGEGVSPETRTDLWAAVTAGANVVVRISSRLAFVARIEGLVALRRPAFHLAPDDVLVFRMGEAGAQAAVGLEVRFPR